MSHFEAEATPTCPMGGDITCHSVRNTEQPSETCDSIFFNDSVSKGL